jgi:predicted GIY-YIG superfamily endonuclease
MVQIFMDTWEANDEIPNEKSWSNACVNWKSPYTTKLYKKYFGGFRRLIGNVIKYQTGEITKEDLTMRHDIGKDNDYTVYCLRSTRDGIWRYAGETSKLLEKRLAQHHSAATKRDDALAKWMRREKQDSFQIEIVCLERNAEYRTAEKRWIAKLLKEGAPLLNGNGKYLTADAPGA